MEQQFSLSWNNFHGNLTKGFSTLLANSEFVDVTLAVDDHLIQAHKIVLSICSPYFKKMFKMNPCQHPIVVLRGVTIKAMRDLLQFMYHGEVSVRQEELTSFISTAEILQIKGLTNKSNDDEAVETPKQEPPQSPNPVTPPNSQLTEPPVELPVEENIVEAVPSNNNITKLAAVKRKPDDATVSPDPSEYQNEKRTRVRERLKCEKHHQAGARSRLLNCDHKQRYSEPIITPPAAHLTDSIESTSQNNSDINGDHSMSAINLSDVKLESEDQNMYKMLQRRYSDSVLSNSQDFKKENGSPDEHYGDAKGNEEGVLSLVVGVRNNHPQLPPRYKYIFSRKGHKQLVHMNFVYTKHSTSHGKTSWRCVQYFSIFKCPATVETVGSMIYAINHQHNHENCHNKIVQTEVYEMVFSKD